MNRTQVMHERAAGLPWLEHYLPNHSAPQKTALDRFPFTIGRSGDTDLPVDSNRVSRRHAEILQDDGGYRVCDLKSTNGTFLNGRQINEASLSDGDLLVIADVEFTFFTGRVLGPSDAATQVIGGRARHVSGSEEAWAVQGAVRKLEEMLCHRAVVAEFDPVVELDGGRHFGYQAREGQGLDAAFAQDAFDLIFETDCRAACRWRRMRRMAAVEESAKLPRDAAVFLPLDESEIGEAGLADRFERLARMVGDSRPLVVLIPERAVSDVGYLREFFNRLRSAGIGLGYNGVSGAPPAAMHEVDLRPDYLVLDRGLARNVHRSSIRRAQLETIARAGRDCGCGVVATALEKPEEADVCLRTGCQFGQGALFAQAVRPTRSRASALR